MILPIIASLSREVFLQVPQANQEAALALGATRWEMIRIAVLPFGRPGIIGATMLGLGRALGETIAVAVVLSSAFVISCDVLEPGGNTHRRQHRQRRSARPTRPAAARSSPPAWCCSRSRWSSTCVARAVIYRRREFSGGTL